MNYKFKIDKKGKLWYIELTPDNMLVAKSEHTSREKSLRSLNMKFVGVTHIEGTAWGGESNGN